MILVDTSGLLAVLDGSERSHAAASHAIEQAEPPLLLSPFVLAELDYLLAQRVSSRAQLELLDEVGRGSFALEPFDQHDVARARAVIERFADLEIGLADASIVVLAERHGARSVLTLDRRHFAALRTSDDEGFRLLPDES